MQQIDRVVEVVEETLKGEVVINKLYSFNIYLLTFLRDEFCIQSVLGVFYLWLIHD